MAMKRRQASESRASRRDDRYDDDDEDEDEETTPRRRRSSKGDDKGTDVQSGWGALQDVGKQASGFADRLKLEADPKLVKFLSDAPFAVFNQHWVEGLTSTRQKSFICRNSVVDPDTGTLYTDCPLCGIGDNPMTRALFAVVQLEEGQNPRFYVLEASKKLAELIQTQNNNRKIGPLTRHYWALGQTGGGRGKGAPSYMMSVVRERDIDPDDDDAEWPCKPLSEKDIDKFTKQAKASRMPKAPTLKFLKGLIRELNDEA